ncbi:acyl-CoA dehydrogenase family protein [Imbroritus primus]|uniref:acyl-CoA dehydrogenase family protein n=1 Tax=Imbroritus primus TaxID=3058603 RepID=UPI003D161747
MTTSALHFEHLDTPFFDAHHRQLARELDHWAASNITHPAPAVTTDRQSLDEHCRMLVRQLGEAGFLRHCVPQADASGRADIDTRAVCLAREILARHSGLADFAFAMQGLGSGAISLDGSGAQRTTYLDRVAAGSAIAAFALSEPGAGSDVGGMTCTAEPAGDGYILNGEKTWISNGGIADFYVVFARAPGTTRSSGISAFIVEAGTPGLEIAERLDVIAPHPLARLRFTNCQVAATQRLGAEGTGFKLAMRTLDIFRTSVGAAALGFARAALAQGLERAAQRRMFGTTLGAMQLTQATLADMATQVECSAMLVYRAAWLRDQGRTISREAAMAKLVATESAQRVADAAVQLWGGAGVEVGSIVEQLYRDVRALRIYEGASEVQRLIIGTSLLKQMQQDSAPATA